MTTKSSKKVYLQAVTMINPAKGWVEIHALLGVSADYVSNQIELAWLTRYPQPTKIILDRGNEFLAEFKTLIQDDYDITLKPIREENCLANAILERMHQSIGNIIHTTKVQNMVLDDNDLCNSILASTMFALKATVHTTTSFTPTQLLFVRDALLNTRHKDDRHVIKERKQKLINRGNDRKNCKHQSHTYKVEDQQILLESKWKTKFSQDAYKGLLQITAARNNGTVRARFGRVTNTYNICNIKPYRE